ncbi:unnamed protein product [Mytilus coruscus]|uniref:Reverse transcriptase domain-containing protein n=1 Tax=Mytilus coruscus TaxID=42192 RepID=A0A6J8E548_MYTCO|nr:unnamed protein product [Mytilus coruscus]
MLLPSQVRFQGDIFYQTSQFNEIKIQVDKITSQINFNTRNIQMLKTDIGNLDNKMEYQMTHIDNRLHSNDQNMKRQLENHEETMKKHLESNNNLLNNIENMLTKKFSTENGGDYNTVISQPNLPRTSTLYGPENSPAVQTASAVNNCAFVPIYTIPQQVPHTVSKPAASYSPHQSNSNVNIGFTKPFTYDGKSDWEIFGRCKNLLTPEQTGTLRDLLHKNQKGFSMSKYDIVLTDIVQHKINTNGARPVKQAPRQLPIAQRNEVEVEIIKMLDNDIIRPSQSPYSSPLVIVRKADSSIRVCCDFRRVNLDSVKDSYPLPRIDDSIDA